MNFGVQDLTKENQSQTSNMLKRFVLISLKIIATVIAVLAYQNHDSFYFTNKMAWYCFIMSLLMTYYSWNDRISRLIMLSMVGLCANNLVDELWGVSYTFGLTEYVFGVLILINLIYQMYRLWRAKHIK